MNAKAESGKAESGNKLFTLENTLRFLAHEAQTCRDRDSHEAFCLLLPALVDLHTLPAMEDVEAAAFNHEFHQLLKERHYPEGAR